MLFFFVHCKDDAAYLSSFATEVQRFLRLVAHKRNSGGKEMRKIRRGLNELMTLEKKEAEKK